MYFPCPGSKFSRLLDRIYRLLGRILWPLLGVSARKRSSQDSRLTYKREQISSFSTRNSTGGDSVESFHGNRKIRTSRMGSYGARTLVGLIYAMITLRDMKRLAWH
ncbi:uncharacterized protein LAJ45_02512 [Morchella importuna]|uniref:uncharacterized protein n=1 Tax=Morchella importuna TaxID=1174673 RepID=UPI001E8E930A|nr:uncharacterized protein LAJ45_02512 [Morchella importuna]KAH8153699.1 hypothetical protein LAJ45_02512 [Morchella importuna]